VTAGGSYTLQTIVGSCTSATSAPTVVTIAPSSAVTLIQRNDTLFATGTTAGVTYTWYFGTIRLTTTTSFLVPPFAGTYSVDVTLGTCTASSAPLLVTALATGLSASTIKLVPNPATGTTYLQLSGNTHSQVMLQNTLGQVIRTYQLPLDGNNGADLDLTGISAGTYIINVLGTNIRQRLVVR
jgi:hypothetical protein